MKASKTRFETSFELPSFLPSPSRNQRETPLQPTFNGNKSASGLVVIEFQSDKVIFPSPSQYQCRARSNIEAEWWAVIGAMELL
uniref:Uncharacterized protein n=1 Tax=Nelumbo nucifera TaxID=4432 RepID=A0A822ZC04_NELNU|nr:TPA_asm: hypothetical protein HUJ06_000292 [Nelumbo nucifera]